jgi:hypothetical protein
MRSFETLRDDEAVPKPSPSETTGQQTTRNVNSPQIKPHLAPLNTLKLSDKLRHVLHGYKIDHETFVSRVLAGLPVHIFNKMILTPRRWDFCANLAKRHYHAIDEWLKSEEEICMLADLCAKQRSFVSDSTPHFDPESLDTRLVARTVNDLLCRNETDRKSFARNYLGITATKLAELLLEPTAWDECPSSSKKLYIRMNDWAKKNYSH